MKHFYVVKNPNGPSDIVDEHDFETSYEALVSFLHAVNPSFQEIIEFKQKVHTGREVQIGKGYSYQLLPFVYGEHLLQYNSQVTGYFIRNQQIFVRLDDGTSYVLLDDLQVNPQNSCPHTKYKVVPLIYTKFKVCTDCGEDLGNV